MRPKRLQDSAKVEEVVTLPRKKGGRRKNMRQLSELEMCRFLSKHHRGFFQSSMLQEYGNRQHLDLMRGEKLRRLGWRISKRMETVSNRAL